MSPTSSSRPLAGRKALSATPRTNSLPSAFPPLPGSPSRRTDYGGRRCARKRQRGDLRRTAAGAGTWPRCRWYGRQPGCAPGPLPQWPCSRRSRGAVRTARTPVPRPASSRSTSSTPASRRASPWPRPRRCGWRSRTRAIGPVPQVAVTVETDPRKGTAPVAFGRASAQPGLADPDRPVWIVDRGPRGGSSAYVNTWATGPLGEGETRAMTWRVTAVAPGRYTLTWRVAAGAGRRRAADRAGAHGGRVPRDRSPTPRCPRPWMPAATWCAATDRAQRRRDRDLRGG